MQVALWWWGPARKRELGSAPHHQHTVSTLPSVLDAIGNTPMIRLNAMSEQTGCEVSTMRRNSQSTACNLSIPLLTACIHARSIYSPCSNLW